jgi:hypothetical protein
MGLIEMNDKEADRALFRVVRSSLARALEEDIRRLYLGRMDEPVPARLVGILRAGLTASKA